MICLVVRRMKVLRSKVVLRDHFLYVVQSGCIGMANFPFPDLPPSPLHRIQVPFEGGTGCDVYIKRDDLLGSPLQGNKFRKLKYNLLHAIEQGFREIVSFGGAYSNHVHALSFIPRLTGLSVTCYIRGEIDDPDNPTLRFAREKGIRLIPVTRQSYRLRNDAAFQEALMRKHPKGFLVPEGGTNAYALEGVAECANEISAQLGADPFLCIVPVGSGGTMAGLIRGFGSNVRVIGVPAFAGVQAMQEIQQRMENMAGDVSRNWELDGRFHFGGFARMTPELFDLILAFHQETGILLDPVYTCKMIAAFRDRWSRGDIESSADIVLIHTGGIQGWGGFRQRFGEKYDTGQLPVM